MTPGEALESGLEACMEERRDELLEKAEECLVDWKMLPLGELKLSYEIAIAGLLNEAIRYGASVEAVKEVVAPFRLRFDQGESDYFLTDLDSHTQERAVYMRRYWVH